MMQTPVNWTAIGAVGELIGAFGVMITVVYLALQVRQNTRSVRGSVYDSLATSLEHLNRPLVENGDLARALGAVTENWASASEVDRSRIVHFYSAAFKLFENVHYQWSQGLIEDELWKGWKRLMLTYFWSPGVQAWWPTRRGAYSETFGRYLEGTEPRMPLSPPGLMSHIRSDIDPPGR
jgi:hypothetical protein